MTSRRRARSLRAAPGGNLKSPSDLVCTRCGRLLPAGHAACPFDGARLVPQPRAALGRVLGRRYRLDAFLGGGGWAMVYRACDRRQHEDVAVKVLRPELRQRPSALVRFFAEARILSQLHHPHVVAVRDYGQSGKLVFLVLELLEGRALSEAILHEAPLSPPRAVRIARQICDGLGAAHDRAVVHRDLKPDNILLVRGGGEVFVKVADFGIARSLLSDGDRETFAGTPAYASPEQARGEQATARSDLYSLGLVLYEMLTGEPAFPHESPILTLQRRVREMPPDIRGKVDGSALPEGLGDVVMRLLVTEAEQRPRNAAEVSALLAPYEEQAHASRAAEPAEVFDLPSTYEPLDLDPPLVGREAERAALLPLVRRLGETEHATLLLLAGAGGVGKTHLAAHLGDVACAERGARRFTRECTQDGRELLRILEQLIGDPTPARLEAILGDARSAEELLRVLRPTERPLEHDVAAQHDYQCQVVLDAFAHFAAQQPLVVVLDDAHGADALTRAVVKRLPLWSRDRGKGLLFVVTWTPEEGAEPPAEAGRERFADRSRLVRVEPLSADESDAMVRKIGNFDAEACALIVRMAAGNPLHVVQLIRHLRMETLLIPTRRGWRLSPRARFDFSVPLVATGLAARQVARLRATSEDGALAADLLERASLAGDRVPMPLVHALLARERRADLAARLDVLVEILVSEDLIQRSDDALAFRHSLVREAIAARVADPARIHRALAEAHVASRAGEPETSRAAALHFLRAGLATRALPLALRSARLSNARGDIPRASEDYLLAQRALDAMKKPRRAARLEIEIGLGDTLLKLGQTRDAEEHFVKALGISKVAAAYLGLGQVGEAKGDEERALGALERAERLFRREGRPREATDAALCAAKVLEKRSDFTKARDRLEAALAAGGDSVDRVTVGRIWMAMGQLCLWAGDIERSLALSAQAEGAFETAGARLVLGECRYRIASGRRQRDEFDAALAYYRSALDLLSGGGHARGSAACLAGMGVAYAEQGALGQARRLHEASLRLAEDLEDSWMVASIMCTLGWVSRTAGDPQEATEWLRTAIDLGRRIGARATVLIAETNLAQARLDLGDQDGAAVLFKGSLANPDLRSREQGECHGGLGDIALGKGRPVEARRHYEMARASFLQAGHARLVASIDTKLASF